MRKLIACLILSVVSLGGFAQRVIENGVVVDKTAQAIVDKIAKKIETESPLRIAFTMTTQNKGKQIDSQSGTFLSNGAKFHLSYGEAEDWCDGKNLWHFVKENNEVELNTLEEGNNIFNLTLMIKSYSKDYRPKLIREEKRGNATVNIIDLVPKGKSAVSKIRIVANASTFRLSEMTISVRAGNTYIYKFGKYETNVKVQPSDFVFPKSKYPSAEIIDLR